MRKLSTVLIAVVLIIYSTCGFSLTEQQQCEFNGINYEKASVFVKDLKAAVKTDSGLSVADLVSFPLRLNNRKNGKLQVVMLRSRTSFLNQYGAIFTAKNKKLLLNSAGIFCNYQGAMLASGFIWFTTSENNRKPGIFAINLNEL